MSFQNNMHKITLIKFRYNLQKADISLRYVKNFSIYYFQLISLLLNAKPSKYSVLKHLLWEILHHAAENWKLPWTGKPWPVWLEGAIISGKKRTKMKKSAVCHNPEINWFLRSTCTLAIVTLILKNFSWPSLFHCVRKLQKQTNAKWPFCYIKGCWICLQEYTAVILNNLIKYFVQKVCCTLTRYACKF